MQGFDVDTGCPTAMQARERLCAARGHGEKRTRVAEQQPKEYLAVCA